MLGKVHKVNHFYVFIVANPVAMLDIVLTNPVRRQDNFSQTRNGETLSHKSWNDKKSDVEAFKASPTRPLIKVTGVTSDDMEVAHSTAEINGQLLVKRKMMCQYIYPTDEQTIPREVDDSSKLVGDGPLLNRFSSDTDVQVDDLSTYGDNSPPLILLDPVE